MDADAGDLIDLTHRRCFVLLPQKRTTSRALSNAALVVGPPVESRVLPQKHAGGTSLVGMGLLDDARRDHPQRQSADTGQAHTNLLGTDTAEVVVGWLMEASLASPVVLRGIQIKEGKLDTSESLGLATPTGRGSTPDLASCVAA